MAYSLLDVLLKIKNSPEKSLQEIVKTNKSILGDLYLEEKAIRFQPIIERIINGKPIIVEE